MTVKEIARDKKLKGTDLRVLLYLFSELTGDRWRFIPQRVIAQELNIPREKVSVSLKRLESRNIIKVKRRGRCNYYKLNEDFESIIGEGYL